MKKIRNIGFIAVIFEIIFTFLLPAFIEDSNDVGSICIFMMIIMYLELFFLQWIDNALCQDGNVPQNNSRNNLDEFYKARECELEDLLSRLDIARTDLSASIQTEDIAKISEAEESLDTTLTEFLNFLENYSNFGKTINNHR